MIKLLLLVVWAVGFVQGDEFEELKKVTEAGSEKLLEVGREILNSVEDYPEMIAERKECLEWEHNSQELNLNQSVKNAVFKGMNRNNQFSTFQCISWVAQETRAKLEASYKHIENATKVIVERGVQRVKVLFWVLPEQLDFIHQLYTINYQEMKKAKNEEERKKILDGVVKKMNYFNAYVAELEQKANANKFKFFEEYVEYVFNTDTYIRKIVREGGQKALKCVS